MSILDEKPFYKFVREERFFCTILTHLLLQDSPNLSKFLDMVNSKLSDAPRLSANRIEEVQVYVEFSFLRDHWDSLRRYDNPNEAKRERILTLLSKVPQLSDAIPSGDLPTSIPEFNAYFMGDRGRLIRDDIVFPGQWSVEKLYEEFGNNREVFRDFCKFKWAFNIKPDMVILLPDSKPICIEAKLESKEGLYPTAKKECEKFDELFEREPGHGRVKQIELQLFMFEHLLDSPCQSVVIGRTSFPTGDNSVSLTWKQVFGPLDTGSSYPFVEKLIRKNKHVNSPA